MEYFGLKPRIPRNTPPPPPRAVSGDSTVLICRKIVLIGRNNQTKFPASRGQQGKSKIEVHHSCIDTTLL